MLQPFQSVYDTLKAKRVLNGLVDGLGESLRTLERMTGIDHIATGFGGQSLGRRRSAKSHSNEPVTKTVAGF